MTIDEYGVEHIDLEPFRKDVEDAIDRIQALAEGSDAFDKPNVDAIPVSENPFQSPAVILEDDPKPLKFKAPSADSKDVRKHLAPTETGGHSGRVRSNPRPAASQSSLMVRKTLEEIKSK